MPTTSGAKGHSFQLEPETHKKPPGMYSSLGTRRDPETATGSVVAEGVASIGNDKKSGCGGWLFINAIIQIVIGGYFHHDCPAQPYIPIYMEVMGTATIVAVIAHWWFNYSPENYLVSIILALVHLFCFCFLITGCVWVYSIYPPNYNKLITQLIPHCNKTLYLFAFIDTTITCVLAGGSHINDCKDIPFILIYLMGFGGGILVFCYIKECFFLWFIVGNVFIFRSFNDFRDGKLHCDKTLYLVAVMSTIVIYALLFALCCAYVHDEEESNDEPV